MNAASFIIMIFFYNKKHDAPLTMPLTVKKRKKGGRGGGLLNRKSTAGSMVFVERGWYSFFNFS